MARVRMWRCGPRARLTITDNEGNSSNDFVTVVWLLIF